MGDLNLPSGYGGLVRYNEEYPSKIMLKPAHVIAFVIAVVVFVIALKVFWPL
jgi:preprotein translocase subunit Sec61beta